MRDPSELGVALAPVLAGPASPQELLNAAGLDGVLPGPGPAGVLTVATPQGPVVPAFSSPFELERAHNAVSWISTSGMGLLPDGHDLAWLSRGLRVQIFGEGARSARTATKPGSPPWSQPVSAALTGYPGPVALVPGDLVAWVGLLAEGEPGGLGPCRRVAG